MPANVSTYVELLRADRKRAFAWLSEKDPEKRLTCAEIARRLNRSRQTICRWEGLNTQQRRLLGVPGRPTKLSAEQRNFLRYLLVRDRWNWSLEDITEYVLNQNKVSLSISQASRLRRQLRKLRRRQVPELRPRIE